MATLAIGEQQHDLGALVGFGPLQELLTDMSKMQAAQGKRIEELQAELEEERAARGAAEAKLAEELALKANEKAVGALALEISKDKGSVMKGVDAFQSEVSGRLDKAETKVERQDEQLKELRKLVDTKCERTAITKCDKRIDACATAAMLDQTRGELLQRAEDEKEAAAARATAAEEAAAALAARVGAAEEVLPTLQPRAAAAEAVAALEAADASQRAATEALGLSVSEQLGALKGSTDERFMQVREVADEHAAHLGRLDDLVATKADHAATQTSFAAVQARQDKEKREAAAALAEVAAAAEARQSAAEEQLASHASQILDLQVEIQTKATLDGLAELAERIGLCALREEAREQIENLRHESASRIRMLKERLDHTDRELLRQLEESHSLDNIERVEALTALIESKADKDVAERWVESSEALHMELQASAQFGAIRRAIRRAPPADALTLPPSRPRRRCTCARRPSARASRWCWVGSKASPTASPACRARSSGRSTGCTASRRRRRSTRRRSATPTRGWRR